MVSFIIIIEERRDLGDLKFEVERRFYRVVLVTKKERV